MLLICYVIHTLTQAMIFPNTIFRMLKTKKNLTCFLEKVA